jgi:hypothetical protein
MISGVQCFSMVSLTETSIQYNYEQRATVPTPKRFRTPNILSRSKSKRAKCATQPDDLRLDRLLLLAPLRVPLPLFLEILPLLVSTHPRQHLIPLLLLELVALELALVGLLVVVELADLGNLLLARRFDAAQGFRAEVCR